MNKYEVEVTAFAENSVRAIAFYIRNELEKKVIVTDVIYASEIRWTLWQICR